VVTGFPNYPGGRVYPGYKQRLYQREVLDRVEVFRVPLYPSHDRSGARRVLNFGSFALSATAIGSWLVDRADVVYAYHPPATVGLPALVWQRLRATPFVYHIADMWPESVTQSGMIQSERARACAERAISWWCSNVYRRAAAITVLSPGFKRLLVERGVPESKVSVIFNWADEAIFVPQPSDPALAAEMGMFGRFNVLYAGNLGPYQALEVAIRAARRVEDIDGFQLVLVGTGQDEGRLRQLTTDLGVKNVRFLGHREYTEMGRINALADVLLVSLRDLPFFGATIPSKTQVSLASGRPVLLAVAGDAARLITESGAGIVCPPDDEEGLASAFRRVHALDASARDEMGSRGRAYYEREFSLERGGSQMEELLEQVVAARSR